MLSASPTSKGLPDLLSCLQFVRHRAKLADFINFVRLVRDLGNRYGDCR